MYQYNTVEILSRALRLKKRVYQSKINTFKFEETSESQYGKYKNKCLQNSFTGSL